MPALVLEFRIGERMEPGDECGWVALDEWVQEQWAKIRQTIEDGFLAEEEKDARLAEAQDMEARDIAALVNYYSIWLREAEKAPAVGRGRARLGRARSRLTPAAGGV